MTKAPLLIVGNGGLNPHFPPVIAVSQSPEPFASSHSQLLSYLSLRAKRGNLSNSRLLIYLRGCAN